MINQIKNLIEDIENCTDTNELYLKHTELSKLILLNLSTLDDEKISKMNSEDILTDVFYEIDEISKQTINFITANIKFMEQDLKGSDFETNIISNKDKLQSLKVKLNVIKPKYDKYLKLEDEIQKINKEIEQYINFDLKASKEKNTKVKERLSELKAKEEDNLKAYNTHLNENKNIELQSSEIRKLSDEIKILLDKMDILIKENI